MMSSFILYPWGLHSECQCSSHSPFCSVLPSGLVTIHQAEEEEHEWVAPGSSEGLQVSVRILGNLLTLRADGDLCVAVPLCSLCVNVSLCLFACQCLFIVSDYFSFLIWLSLLQVSTFFPLSISDTEGERNLWRNFCLPSWSRSPALWGFCMATVKPCLLVIFSGYVRTGRRDESEPQSFQIVACRLCCYLSLSLFSMPAPLWWNKSSVCRGGRPGDSSKQLGSLHAGRGVSI